MLATKCYEICHARLVAAFDVATEELPALRKADGVDCGSFGEDWMRCKIGADFIDLDIEIPQKCSGAVRSGVIAQMDEIGIGSWIGMIQDVTD